MAKTVIVTSGKGGVGKSTICVALGKALAKLGKKVLLIELDSGLRCLDIMLDIQDKVVYDLQDAVDTDFDPQKAIVSTDKFENISLISAPYNGDFIITKEEITRLKTRFSEYYDFIIMDSGAGFGENFTNVSDIADMALIIVTPDAICVRDGRRASDMLYASGVEEIRLIINKVNVDRYNAIQNFDTIIDDTSTQLIAIIPREDSLIMGYKPNSNTLWQKTVNNLAFRLCDGNIELAII
ncbi:MAG: AAA family ATPase [Oscillospiraceae bacterium]